MRSFTHELTTRFAVFAAARVRVKFFRKEFCRCPVSLAGESCQMCEKGLFKFAQPLLL